MASISLRTKAKSLAWPPRPHTFISHISSPILKHSSLVHRRSGTFLLPHVLSLLQRLRCCVLSLLHSFLRHPFPASFPPTHLLGFAFPSSSRHCHIWYHRHICIIWRLSPFARMRTQKAGAMSYFTAVFPAPRTQWVAHKCS